MFRGLGFGSYMRRALNNRTMNRNNYNQYGEQSDNTGSDKREDRRDDIMENQENRRTNRHPRRRGYSTLGSFLNNKGLGGGFLQNAVQAINSSKRKMYDPEYASYIIDQRKNNIQNSTNPQYNNSPQPGNNIGYRQNSKQLENLKAKQRADFERMMNDPKNTGTYHYGDIWDSDQMKYVRNPMNDDPVVVVHNKRTQDAYDLDDRDLD